MAGGSEALARGDFAHVTVVRCARGLMVDKYGAAAAPRPGLELDRVQARDVIGADDIHALATNPSQIGRVFLGRELLREVVRNERVLCHKNLLPFQPW